MASVEVTITGMLYDKLARTTQNVVLIGEASLTGVGIGGGPLPGGPGKPPGGGDPPGIWGGPIDPYPGHPLPEPPGGGNGRPPGIWGPNDPRPNPPIAFPPGWVGGVPPLPPGVNPPDPPPPGSPTTAVPGNWPVQPVTPPAYMIVQYPGIGPVIVAPPAQTQQS